MMLKRSRIEAMAMDLEGEVVEGVRVVSAKKEAEEGVVVIGLKQKEAADSKTTEVLDLTMTEMVILTGLVDKEIILIMNETTDQAFKTREDFIMIGRREQDLIGKGAELEVALEEVEVDLTKDKILIGSEEVANKWMNLEAQKEVVRTAILVVLVFLAFIQGPQLQKEWMMLMIDRRVTMNISTMPTTLEALLTVPTAGRLIEIEVLEGWIM